jgi:hypothetical protein
MLNRCGPTCLKHRLALVQVNQSDPNSCPFISKLAPSLFGFVLDAVLRGVSSSVLEGPELFGEECWCSGLGPRWAMTRVVHGRGKGRSGWADSKRKRGFGPLAKEKLF